MASDHGVGSPVDRNSWPRVVGSAVDTATSVRSIRSHKRLDSSDVQTTVHSHDWRITGWKMRSFRQYFQLTSQVAHVSRQSNNRALSFAPAQTVWARSSRTGAISWARHGTRPTERHTHAQAPSYTSVHAGGQTHTKPKELKEKRGYLEMGWGTQPQQQANALKSTYSEKQTIM